MRLREWRETGQTDLFKARLEQIVDMKHAVAKLAAAIDWGFFEKSFGALYNDGPGQPPLPTRLMAGLAILEHMHNLSDEGLCERWVENPYYQLCASSSAKGSWRERASLCSTAAIPSSRPHSLSSAARKRRQGWPKGHRRRRRGLDGVSTVLAWRGLGRSRLMRPDAAPPSCVRANAPC